MSTNTPQSRSLESQKTSFSEIPVIDVAPLIDGSDPESVAGIIGETCKSVGFLYIKNHGVKQSLIEDTYRQSAAFFNLPMDEKVQLHIRNSGETLRGYVPIYGENVDPDYTRDFKECFDLGADEDVVSPFFGPNLMPSTLPDFKSTLEEYHQAMLDLGRKLVSAISISLDLPADYFESRQRHPITIQRLLHYPPQSGEVKLQELGVGAHTDYGFLTILAQDDNGGLQVQNHEGQWIDAPPIPGTFVVNIGDLVQTLTNGRYLSTLHRVINSSGRQRYSLPFFLDMDFDALVETVPTCKHDDGTPEPEIYTCGAHKYQRFLDSYEHLQEA